MAERWDSCSNPYNTENCFTLESNISRRLDCYDARGEEECDDMVWFSSYSQYFFSIVSIIQGKILIWNNVFYSTAVVFIVTVVTYKGVKSMEKFICYSLAISGINFVILLYYSLIQRGTGLGLKYFLKIDWTSMKYREFWVTAFKLALWSTGLGTGGLRVLGSQNKFRGHSYMNGMMMVLVLITVTTVYMMMYLGLAGNLSYHSNTPVKYIFLDKEPLIFAKMPRMLESLKGSKGFWNLLFFSNIFLMLMAKIAILSFIMVKTAMELFPKMEKHPKKTILIMCFVVYSVVTLHLTSFGLYLHDIILTGIVRGPVISIITFLQTTVVIYIYGLTTVVDDMHFMWGFRMPLLWQIVLFLSPIILFIFCVSQVMHFYETFLPRRRYTKGMEAFFKFSVFVPIIVTVGCAIWHVRKMIWKCKWKNMFSPKDSWYLSDRILRKSREMFAASSMTEEYLYRQSKRREIESYNAMYDTV